MQIYDGHTGEPHISSQHAADCNMGIWGFYEDAVLPVGQELAFEIISNNVLEIHDGAIISQGRRGTIDRGEAETLFIENGTQGATRNDIIVARYKRDTTSLVESFELRVIKGVNGGGDPELEQGVVRDGSLIHEMALYRVRLDGINIIGVDTLFDIWSGGGGGGWQVYAITLYANKWQVDLPTGGYVYVFEHEKILAPSEMQVWPDVDVTAPQQQISVFDAAVIWTWEHDIAGHVVLRAFDKLPVIDIQCLLVLQKLKIKDVLIASTGLSQKQLDYISVGDYETILAEREAALEAERQAELDRLEQERLEQEQSEMETSEETDEEIEEEIDEEISGGEG